MKLPEGTDQLINRLALILILVCASPWPLAKWRPTSALSIDQHQGGRAQSLDSAAPVNDGRLAADPTQIPQDSSKRPDTRRPIWALAHMVNSIKELDYRLKLGANAVEADVTFARNGSPKYTYHGPPCDCWRHCHQREGLDDFLAFVREESIEVADGLGHNLTLLFLDLKLDPLDGPAKARAGLELANSITGALFVAANRDLPRAQTFHLILSINHAADIELVRNFVHALELSNSSYLLERNIGFDVGMNDDLQLIEATWRKFATTGVHLNLWQGDGYTNCFSPFYNLERLSRALSKRDAPQGYPAKIYHWTIDLRDRMRESLLMGVDGIMTNHPERLLALLQEPDIAHDFRLATRHDSPFQRVTRRAASRSGEMARYQRSAQSSSGGLLGSILDVLTSWLNYVKEIPFLSLPTTLMSKSASALRLQRRYGSTSSPKTTNSTNVPSKLTSVTTTQTTPTTPTTTTTTTTTTTSTVTNQQRIAIQSSNVTQVKLSQQLEYKIENVTSDSASIPSIDNQQRQAGLAETTPAQNQTEADTMPEYEGPKWYTSLISNMLVSAIKVVLPP